MGCRRSLERAPKRSEGRGECDVATGEKAGSDGSLGREIDAYRRCYRDRGEWRLDSWRFRRGRNRGKRATTRAI